MENQRHKTMKLKAKHLFTENIFFIERNVDDFITKTVTLRDFIF